MALKVAFIGTGKNPENPGLMGYAMAYRHANSYALLDEVEMVAVADRRSNRTSSPSAPGRTCTSRWWLIARGRACR